MVFAGKVVADVLPLVVMMLRGLRLVRLKTFARALHRLPFRCCMAKELVSQTGLACCLDVVCCWLPARPVLS